jgi:hypothetical protein
MTKDSAEPDAHKGEIARYPYRRADKAVRIKVKIKTANGKRFVNWYWSMTREDHASLLQFGKWSY